MLRQYSVSIASVVNVNQIIRLTRKTDAMLEMRIAHFQVRNDRWIKEGKTHFLQVLASIWSNIFTNSNEKKTCLSPSIVYIQISNTYLPEFWIFYFMSRLTLYECLVNVCIQQWFLIQNWTFEMSSLPCQSKK